jgi:tryptophanyl-tRNA synthetase
MDRKMSKSAGNTVLLSDPPDEIRKKVRTAVTDPQKARKNDPGRPEVCLVYTYHPKFNAAGAPEVDRNCRSGALGCVECKLRVADRIGEALAPLRERRAHFESHMSEVHDILADGEQRARERAQQTMTAVHSSMGLG